ncbi:hypothetical protein [Telluribacter sp. SYSU D00476]|uniref:hypothetical protein n=1 Tax=Telluribacter sp. SYSU D00476 TaxID=2811430 RepID=UPI001FF3B1F1|nr:hypothetical protein [Telluribacter sp. SYSU D00476]
MKVDRRMLGWGLLMSAALLLTDCRRADEVDPQDENELITTVRLNFTEQGTTTATTFEFRDPDGEGGNPPTRFDQIKLKPNTSYNVTVELLDESKTPVVDLTDEIAEKADEHLMVYTATPATLLTYTYGDKDSRNFPIGLTGTAQTGTAGRGQLKVQLRHQPPVNGTAVKNGMAAPGSDDVNLDFELIVE